MTDKEEICYGIETLKQWAKNLDNLISDTDNVGVIASIDHITNGIMELENICKGNPYNPDKNYWIKSRP